MPSRCPMALVPTNPVLAGEVGDSFADAVADSVVALGFTDPDPRLVIGAMTVALAQQFDRRPGVTLAGEIRRNLLFLMDHAGDAATTGDAERAQQARQRAEKLMQAALGWPVSAEDTALPPAGELAGHVLMVVSGLGYPEDDPRHQLAVVTLRLATKFDTSPSPRLAELIKRALYRLTAFPGEPPSPLDRIQSGLIAREAEDLL